MDSAALLDLLGNENRRRILRLLAHKPCYVTEISEYLGVSPKAVIDHLRKLDEAGLVESRVDDSRRKYFSIARNLRLEVSVSPYEFGTKSAYSASPSLDITACRYLSLNVERPERETDLADLAGELERLEQLENELSLAQRWVQGRLTEVMERLSEDLGGEHEGRFYAEVLGAVAGGVGTVPRISRQVDASPEVVEGVLHDLADRGLLSHEDGEWQIPDYPSGQTE